MSLLRRFAGSARPIVVLTNKTIAGSRYNAGGATAVAGIEIRSDGGVRTYRTLPATGSTSFTTVSGEWLVSGGLPEDYSVLVNGDAASIANLTGGSSSTGTWIPLSSTRIWEVFAQSVPGNTDEASADLTIAIAKTTSTSIELANASISLNATADSS